jgi:hypothetical protein
MSRYIEGDGIEDREEMWAWIRAQGALASTLRGRRTYELLGELEQALLTMPAPRLIGDYLARDGEVCALGALYCHRARAAGDDWMAAARRLQAETACHGHDPTTEQSIGYDERTAQEVAEEVGTALGLSRALARHIAETNDEPNWRTVETPVTRHAAMLAIVRRWRARYEARQAATP